ncbi:ParA family protein [Tumebacillus permanentifrigoris]|uniref:Chromosome partitioning protein n=1 Tax=Tumebacillus permanentifrigoris TaxID=378543 RepID=A0A316D2I4_9BACL|nr:ParA family protein [Tumebacillus permanentifrigoris]PWK05080.1 chromosome partitioning protein [Tumebacillus permanentifrigoris]
MSLAKTIAVMVEKGGVGKTTTAVNFSTGLANRGKRVLLIDLDPQGNATNECGIDPTGSSTYDLFKGTFSAAVTKWGFDLIGATQDLASIPLDHSGRYEMLAAQLTDSVRTHYDYIIIDMPPGTLETLPLNGLYAADEVIIPLQAEQHASDGVAGFIDTLWSQNEVLGREVKIAGVLVTMYTASSPECRQIVQEATDAFDDLGIPIFVTKIPRSRIFPNAVRRGHIALVKYKSHKAVKAYQDLADEYLLREVNRP